MINRDETQVKVDERVKDIARKDTRITDLANAGAKQAGHAEPVAEAGLFAEALPEWQPNIEYAKNAMFVFNGCAGFARQHLTSQAIYPPFSPGVESLYGVRPIPDEDGIHPYAYNMAADVGMRVREGDTVYVCISPADPLLYPPSAVPAIFEAEQGV